MIRISCLLRPAVAATLLLGAAVSLAQSTRLDSWNQHQQMAEASPFKDLIWERMGPKFAGGRIEAIDAPKGDLGTIYAAVGAGGVWKTTDGGLSWRPIFENESTFAIGDITISPSDPNTIWVGTGEAHLSGSSYSGTGVFKSTDAGETWTNMALHGSSNIGRVAIDPDDPNLVYVASMGGERGIFKTSDGGGTFKRVLHVDNRVGFVDLVIDPTDSSRLYATAWGRGGSQGSGVYRSQDHGETWVKLTGGLQEKDVDRVAVDVSASEPGVVYALMADRSSPALARRQNASILFRSNDYGETWKRTHEGYVPTYVGWDFCDVRVAPDDADRVYVGGLRLITSEDGGKTFQGEGGFAANKDVTQVRRLHSHTGIGVHLDMHDIWIDPERPERVLMGNDGGLYVSWDRAKTWLHLNNLPIAEFYRIHLDNEEPFQIWGGTQDNASFVGPSTARFEIGLDDEWRQVFLDPWIGGDGFATFPDPNDSSIVYYTQQNGAMRRGRLEPGAPVPVRRPRGIKPRVKAGEPELKFSWDAPLFASSHPGDTVLYCAAQRVFRSTSRGDDWKAISPDFGHGSLSALTESPLDASRLAAGAGRGAVHLTSDGGETWVAAGDGLPGRSVRDIVLSAHDPNRVYVVLASKGDYTSEPQVFVSHDFGVTWNSLSGNLPAEPANVVAEDPKVDGLLFLGTDVGVYASMNGGSEWASLSSTLPTAPTVDLAVHGRDGKLVAATHGLSLFILDILPIREKTANHE